MLVLLDTCVYLRLAKRIRPLLGIKFGQLDYVLTVLPAVEKEVLKNPALKHRNPWFEDGEFEAERDAHAVRMSKDEKLVIEVSKSIFIGHVQSNLESFLIKGRSPPGLVDCEVLAFALARNAIVATDDIGMHILAADMKLNVWHGYQLLQKLIAAKMVTGDLVREIYDALERNGDTTETWKTAKHTTFKKVFGNPKPL